MNTKETNLIRLSWFWFLWFKRQDGRSGHKYTAPFFLTLYALIWLRLIKGEQVGWYAYHHCWLEPGERYEPASIIHDLGTHGVEIRSPLPVWLIRFEMFVRRATLRIRWFLAPRRTGWLK